MLLNLCTIIFPFLLSCSNRRCANLPRMSVSAYGSIKRKKETQVAFTKKKLNCFLSIFWADIFHGFNTDTVDVNTISFDFKMQRKMRKWWALARDCIVLETTASLGEAGCWCLGWNICLVRTDWDSKISLALTSTSELQWTVNEHSGQTAGTQTSLSLPWTHVGNVESRNKYNRALALVLLNPDQGWQNACK